MLCTCLPVLMLVLSAAYLLSHPMSCITHPDSVSRGVCPRLYLLKLYFMGAELELAARDTELGAARSRLCVPWLRPSPGAEGVQGQLQGASLPCDLQRSTSHSNPLFTEPLCPMHGSLSTHDGLWVQQA